MLDPWIIEEIRRREEDRQREREAGRVELPLESPEYRESDSGTRPTEREEVERGIVVIDL